LALGFSNEKLKFFTDNNIDLEEWGAVKVNEEGETSLKNVFAGGDAVRGADLVVTAALDGREVALKVLERIFATEAVSV
jgi:glutamate synthase (NADPH/NADH) small chain